MFLIGAFTRLSARTMWLAATPPTMALTGASSSPAGSGRGSSWCDDSGKSSRKAGRCTGSMTLTEARASSSLVYIDYNWLTGASSSLTLIPMKLFFIYANFYWSFKCVLSVLHNEHQFNNNNNNNKRPLAPKSNWHSPGPAPHPTSSSLLHANL